MKDKQTKEEMLLDLLIELGVDVNTHQDGDVFVKTFTFNEAQLEFLTSQTRNNTIKECVEVIDKEKMVWDEEKMGNRQWFDGHNTALIRVESKLKEALNKLIKEDNE